MNTQIENSKGWICAFQPHRPSWALTPGPINTGLGQSPTSPFESLEQNHGNQAETGAQSPTSAPWVCLLSERVLADMKRASQ